MLRPVVSRLEKCGFDIVAPFSVQEYNLVVQKRYQLPEFSQNNTLALLIANSRALWTPFIQYLADIDYKVDSQQHPLDEYTVTCVSQSLEEVGVKTEVYYPFEMQSNRLLPFQRISSICGLCENSPLSHLCFHPVFGTWLGLRAVVVFDADISVGDEFVVPKATNCCSEEVDNKAKVILDDLMRNTNYHEDHRDDCVWRKWLSLRTLSMDAPYVYSWNQAAYHYSKNQKYLEGDVNRLKKGEYCPDYNWMREFNKDILNYRKGIF